MQETCHSEYGRIRTVYLKQPAAAFHSQEHLDTEWARLNYLSCPDLTLAEKEYDSFLSLFTASGTECRFFPENNITGADSIYCRDAAIATDAGMIICRMGKELRSTEPAACRKAFEKDGIPVLGEILAPGTLEGGDLAWLDRHTLAAGLSYRSNPEGIRQLETLVAPLGVTVIPVALPHYRGPADVFHLMSVLSPVGPDLAVVYSPLLPIVFRDELQRRGFRLVEVPKQEFEVMGCNVLSVGTEEVVMVKGHPETETALREAGCSVLLFDGAEICVKGGGGPTCLSRPLSRFC